VGQSMKVNTVIQGDCLSVMREMDDKSVDLIITDPPYPDQYTDLYHYHEGIIDFLNSFECRQIIFWSAKVEFPLDYTAIHIWNKMVGCGSMYERIFERNGGKNWRVFSYDIISNKVKASMNRDVYIDHPSQKPIKLMTAIIHKFSNPNDLICDPFAGTGTTLVAAKNLGRRYIGIELEEKYCEIARQRLAQQVLALE